MNREIDWCFQVQRDGRCPVCRTRILRHRAHENVGGIVARNGAICCGNCAVDGYDIVVGKMTEITEKDDAEC